MDWDIIYGPMLIGVFFNCILFGIMVMQTFIYYQTFKGDRAWIRLFIFYLIVAETVNTGCDMYLIYQPLVQEFGTSAAGTYFPMMLAASPIVTVCVSTPVQIFTAWRITIVTQRKVAAIIICTFSLLSFAAALWTGIQVVTLKLISRKLELEFIITGVTWLILSALADLIITATLVFSLLTRKKSRYTSSFLNLSIDRIIRLAIQTGLVTFLFSLADALLSIFTPKTSVNFVWDFSISKLYTNALLSTLNARVGWNNLNTAGDRDPDNVLFGDPTTGVAPQPVRHFPSSAGARRRFETTTIASDVTASSHELGFPVCKPEIAINVTKHVISDYSSDVHDSEVHDLVQQA
ncbi:hypothetical protein SERLA73DRAFT_178641 [Serpula lacrymans var. lacrymans S7.3]|uniref:DUF6534 domain-containing protein n=1 Tax=Serpula lacrymans var. lacrymans (strain S7.3) TaxID=936435 RepID=F8PSC2_SERL3|nr:hypothetical protein SERLA73DRAFT_178641 [Serpula lacrymans var. lacrymans S7.3]